MFLFMNPHGCEWKIRGWKFQLSLSQRFLCPLTSCLFPGILFPKFSPDFTMLRSMDFISVICYLSKGMGSHWFPQQTPFPSDVRLKQVTGGASGATLRYFRDFQSGEGTAQAANVSWQLFTPSRAEGPLGIHCSTSCDSTQLTLNPLLFPGLVWRHECLFKQASYSNGLFMLGSDLKRHSWPRLSGFRQTPPVTQIHQRGPEHQQTLSHTVEGLCFLHKV